MKNGMPRRIRLRAVVAYPAISVGLVFAVALALTPFGPSKVMALTPPAAPTVTTASTATSTATSTVTPTPTPIATPSPTANPSPSSSSVSVPGMVSVGHHDLARIEGPPFQADYLPVDRPVPDAGQFQTFRIRFQLRNASADPITVTPQLEYRAEGDAGYVIVPEEPQPGVALQMAREWVPSLGLGGGTMQGPLGEDIAVGDLRIGNAGGFAVNGHRSMGANPDQEITLPSDSYTEQEFTIKLTIDAKYLTGYELRLTNKGAALAGTIKATIRLGGAPAVVLSPGQHQGLAVPGPKPADDKPGPALPAGPVVSTSAGSAFPAAFGASSSATSAVPAASAVSRPSTILYPLVAGTLAAVDPDPLDQIHGPYSMTTDKCGICHRSHTAKAPSLLAKGGSLTNPGSQSSLCLACHDGTGADLAGDQYNNLGQHANNATTREYYSHDAVGVSTPEKQHTQSQLNEFGSVDGAAAPLNRHSECTDCHNPHKSTASTTRDTTMYTDGWAASGRLSGVSGVSVANGETANSTPIYTLLSGVDTNLVPANLVTREYQLCFKCHSGFTKLPEPIADKPSTDFLDKGVEFNPANPSFHPVEAAGKNSTDAMKASLAGDSAYKLWNFKVDQTVRCLNCHASSATSGPNPPLALVDPALPLPGGALAPHTSVNRGILIRNYKDRVLKSGTEPYTELDFALCYVCHGSAPFAPNASSDPAAALQTNFPLHSKHVTDLKNNGSTGTDIDTPGAGAGKAICAECHFRLHSTTNKVPQDVDGTRLVNFAPNVQPRVAGGLPTWTSTGVGERTCAVTCHGYSHTASYATP